MGIREFVFGTMLIFCVFCVGCFENSSGFKSMTEGSLNPAPAPSPSPSPAPSPSPGIVWGVNGHDGRSDYPMTEAASRFQILDANNIRSYRFDVSVSSTAELDALIPLARQYNITLRPMLYPASQTDTYNFVKRYANDIKIWEIGNEQDYDISGAQTRIDAMVETYNGVKQASDELGADLKTSINIMACNSNDPSGTCPNDPNGDQWFLDMAVASGFVFDYITFHYYPHYSDLGYWMDLYLNQVRADAEKYNTKVFINEINCAEIYDGNTDGGSAGDHGCYDSLNQLLSEIQANYSDVVQEVNLYELLDESNLVTSSDPEKHFGLMYNLSQPKPIGILLTNFASP